MEAHDLDVIKVKDRLNIVNRHGFAPAEPII